MDNFVGKIVKIEVEINKNHISVLEGIFYGKKYFDYDSRKVLDGNFFEGRLRGKSNDFQTLNLNNLKYPFKISPTKTDLDFSNLMRNNFYKNQTIIKKLNEKNNLENNLSEFISDLESGSFLKVTNEDSMFIFLKIENNYFINMNKKSAFDTKTYILNGEELRNLLIYSNKIDVLDINNINSPKNVILKMKVLFSLFGYFSLNKENLQKISDAELENIHKAYLKIIDIKNLFKYGVDIFEYFYWMFDKTYFSESITKGHSDIDNCIYFKNNSENNYELIFYLPENLIVNNKFSLYVLSQNGKDVVVKQRIFDSYDENMIAINKDAIKEINNSGLIKIPEEMIELFGNERIINYNYKELLNNNILFEENYYKIIEPKPLIIA